MTARDLAIAGVRYMGFNPVAVVTLVGADLRRQAHVQHSVRIQLPSALADLLPEIIFVIVPFAIVAVILGVAPEDAPVRKLVAGTKDGALHVTVRYERAKIIT